MKALLAWELGGGRGHIHRLAAIASLLSFQNIEPILALNNFDDKGIDLPWRLVGAPKPTLTSFLGQEPTKSYLFTDILHIFGYGDPLILKFQIQAWQNLINLVKPDLIIADFAPTLVLAAHKRLPTLVIGNEFTVPPPVNDFPPFREGLSPPSHGGACTPRDSVPSASKHRSSCVINTIEQVTGIDTSLGQLLNGDRSLIFSIPELDLYREVRHEPIYVGIHNSPIPQNIGDQSGHKWAYLKEDWRYHSTVMEILQPQCEFGALEKVLYGKSVAIHHGGPTTAIACLLAGIPQILLPRYIEQLIRATALVNLGVAQIIPHPNPENLKEVLWNLPQLFQNASIRALSLSHWNQNYLESALESSLNNLL
jgi:hypothetical protein